MNKELSSRPNVRPTARLPPPAAARRRMPSRLGMADGAASPPVALLPSGVQREALEDLVYGVLRAVYRQPNQRHLIGGDRADGRPVVGVVAGLEHLLDVHGGVQFTGQRPAVRVG